MSTFLHRLGALAYRRPWAFVLTWLVVLGSVLGLALTSNGHISSSMTIDGTPSQQVLDQLARVATGSANRIARMHLMAQPPSIDLGEVTDKGSINQRAVLKHRDALVTALHADSLPFTLQPTQQ